MSGSSTSLSLTVRPLMEEDEPAVLDLLRAALGEGPTGHRSTRFFRWKHMENPFGKSFMLVAETRGRIVGLRAFMRWQLRTGTDVLHAARAVDTATHPDFQGKGVFSRLTRESLVALAGEVDLLFNTPNQKSLPGYLKLGWRRVGSVPVSVRVRHPLRFLWGIRSLESGTGSSKIEDPDLSRTTVKVAEALADVETPVRSLSDRPGADRRLETPRDLDYLKWRYVSAPGLGYRAVREPWDGPSRGVAIFRVRPRGSLLESTIAEVIVAPGDRMTAGRLLSRVARAAPVDHVTCSFPSRTAPWAAAPRRGFLSSSQGMTLVVNPLRSNIDPDPADLRSWALSLGDLEVF